jgi:hypothetical protein
MSRNGAAGHRQSSDNTLGRKGLPCSLDTERPGFGADAAVSGEVIGRRRATGYLNIAGAGEKS